VSGFQLTAPQRRRLLEGDYKALQFDELPLNRNTGRIIKKGDRYVLAWEAASASVCHPDDGSDAFVVRTPRRPVWWITVSKVEDDPIRRPEARWLVRFDVTDLRDRDLWLSRSGNYQTTRRGAVDELPVAPSDETRRKARAEFWHLRRLQQHAQEQRERARERSRARRKRAA
jgi:hypothetical protein